MNNPTKISPEEREELLALYQVTTQDLAFFKSQQWTLTNYGLAALAAIAGISQIEGISLSPGSRLFLVVTAALITIFTICVLIDLHNSIQDRRDRLTRVFSRLSDEFRNARGSKQPVSAEKMLYFLIAILIIGFVLSEWLLLMNVCISYA